MYYSYLGDLENIFSPFINFVESLGGMVGFHNILGIILGIGLIILLYVIFSCIVMFQGRKAGLNNDWFAFVPIVRSIYRLDMVGEDRWKIIFIGGLSYLISALLIFLLMLFTIFTNIILSIFFDILILVYLGVCIFFRYNFNRKLYCLFSFNEHLAFINLSASIAGIFLMVGILGGFIPILFFGVFSSIIISINSGFMTVFNFITAFDNRCFVSLGGGGNEPRSNRGQIECTSGQYKDAVFQIESDFEIIIGRDSYFASIIINEGSNSISRKHCGIRYDKTNNDYIVTDYSSNGTYIADTGEKLPRNTPRHLSSGTSIYLGDKNNRFKLL